MHVAKIYFAVRPANEQSKKMRGTLTMVSEANYRGLGQNFPKGNFFLQCTTEIFTAQK